MITSIRNRWNSLPRFFRMAALLNAAAILVAAAWGMASREWYFQSIAGNPRPLEVVKWCLILFNAPGFLVADFSTSLLRLDLRNEYLVMNAVWSAVTLAAWLAYGRLIEPVRKIARTILLLFAAIALVAAVSSLAVAWREGHDPVHSCWSVLALVSMMTGLAGVAAIPAIVEVYGRKHAVTPGR